MNETTPLVLLTGRAGAGKTTLLTHLLRMPSLARAAVLLSGQGENGLKDPRVCTLADISAPLHIGCSCCTVPGGLTGTLRALLPSARRGEITRILLEIGGGADPVPIMVFLTRDPVITAAYHLDGVVGVVDAVWGWQELEDCVAARHQIGLADRIVISKADLADPAPVRDRLRRLNREAPVAEGRNGITPADFILRAGPYNPARLSTNWLRSAVPAGSVLRYDEPQRPVGATFRKPV